jgi:hypothetical protein
MSLRRRCSRVTLGAAITSLDGHHQHSNLVWLWVVQGMFLLLLVALLRKQST